MIFYIDFTQFFKERQKVLCKTYAFDSQCHKCTKGIKEFLSDNSVFDPRIHKAKSELHVLFNMFAYSTQKLDGIETRMQEIGSETEKPQPIDNPPLPKLYNRLAMIFKNKQRWGKELQLRLKIMYIIDPLRFFERLNPYQVESLMKLY